jgi:hypothetical protein
MPIRPSRIQDKTDDPLAEYRQWEFFIKNASDLLSALAKLGLFLGILNVFLYIWKIGFMPPGISLNDGIAFVFTFLAVSFLISVGTIYGSICTFWIYFLLDGFENKKWRPKKRTNFIPESKLPSWAQSGLWAFISFTMLLIVLLQLFLKKFSVNTNLYFLSLAMVGSLFSGVLLAQKHSLKKFNIHNLLIFICALTPCLIAFFSNGEIFSIAMKIIGVRYENISIKTTAENIKSVKSFSKKFNIHVETCPLTGSDQQLFLNANILWTGIGNRTLVEFVNERTFVELNDTPKKILYVQFDSSSIWPVYAQTLRGLSYRTKIIPLPCQG